MSADPGKIVNATSQLAETMFRRHTRDVQRFMLRRVGRPSDADDLAQEVFARLLRIPDVHLIRKPLPYLMGIAANVVSEFRQRKHEEVVLFDSEVMEEISSHLEQRTTLGMAEQLDLQTRLEKAFRQLPPTHRLVLLLVKRDGLSYAEAAKAANLSVHTIEKYLVEARARMQLVLAEPRDADVRQ